MKKFLIVLLSAIFLSGCASTADDGNNSNTENAIVAQNTNEGTEQINSENVENNNVSDEVLDSAKKYDFITSFDGHQCSVEMLTFAKSYFNSDIEGVNAYLADAESKEVDFSSNQNKNYSNVKYILIKGLIYDEETEIANAQLEYAWDDVQMNYYINISMKKVNDSWKVMDFSIEA